MKFLSKTKDFKNKNKNKLILQIQNLVNQNHLITKVQSVKDMKKVECRRSQVDQLR